MFAAAPATASPHCSTRQSRAREPLAFARSLPDRRKPRPSFRSRPRRAARARHDLGARPPRAAGAALDVALRRVDPDEVRPSIRWAQSRRGRSASRAGGGAPLLVVLDDLQWCDPPSLRTLEFALRRRRPSGSVRAGLRSGAGGSSGPCLERTGSRRRGRPARLAGVRDRRASRLATFQTVLRQLHVACDGNPLFGKEVAALLAERWLPDDPATPIPVHRPRPMDRRRVAKLGPGYPRRPPRRGGPAPPTVDVLLAAYQEQISRPRSSRRRRPGSWTVDRERVHFTHPLVAAAVYEAATPARRRAAHARLHACSSTPEERAPHLALAATRPRPTWRRSSSRPPRREGTRRSGRRGPALGAGGLDHSCRETVRRRGRGLEAPRCHSRPATPTAPAGCSTLCSSSLEPGEESGRGLARAGARGRELLTSGVRLRVRRARATRRRVRRSRFASTTV